MSAQAPLLCIGLGNPGTKHARQRHNVGFMVIDGIAEQLGFPAYRSKFHGQFSEQICGNRKVMLLKPDTFMNRSGISVAEARNFLKLDLANIIIFHDELDLVPGKLRLRLGGGAAGHNGLRSITEHNGNDYRRARIGIGHPGHKDKVLSYVLGDFSASDTWLPTFLQATAKHIDLLVPDLDASYQNKVALDMQKWAADTAKTEKKDI